MSAWNIVYQGNKVLGVYGKALRGMAEATVSAIKNQTGLDAGIKVITCAKRPKGGDPYPIQKPA